jgi:formamidopyrimidine-DNA glycosylase
MRTVLQTAIGARADPQQMPDSYLVSHRHRDGTCPLCGEEVEWVKVSGRTAYFCPRHQGDAPV